MARAFEGPAEVGDPAGDAGRGFVVDDADGLEGVGGVRGEPAGEFLRRGSVTPVARHRGDIEAESLRHVLPEGGEVPGLEAQHLVAGAEGVDEGGLPGAGAGGGIDHDGARGAEHRLDRFQ